MARMTWRTERPITGERSRLARVPVALVTLIRVLALRDVSLRDRLMLARVGIRAWLRRGKGDHAVSFPSGGTIQLAGESLNADWNVFSEIFLNPSYNGTYRDAVVIDIGAHKGYFGAFACLRGARTVISYEPERLNFAFLSRAASSFRAVGFDWRVDNRAVAATSGEIDLNVSGESWTHSLLELPERGPRKHTGVQIVESVSLGNVLADHAVQDTARVVAKIDIEGAECDSILSTQSQDWVLIDEVFVETHPGTSCTGNDIVSHLDECGLSRHEDTTAQITHLTRP